MDLGTVTPKIKIEGLLFSMFENTKSLINQTLTKATETLKFKINLSEETFFYYTKRVGRRLLDRSNKRRVFNSILLNQTKTTEKVL